MPSKLSIAEKIADKYLWRQSKLQKLASDIYDALCEVEDATEALYKQAKQDKKEELQLPPEAPQPDFDFGDLVVHKLGRFQAIVTNKPFVRMVGTQLQWWMNVNFINKNGLPENMLVRCFLMKKVNTKKGKTNE